jgi:hypothetical protein
MDKVYFTMRFLLHSFATILFALGFANAQDVVFKFDPESLQAGEAKLVGIVQEALQRTGGNWETQPIHWVLAFKTGFFKDDPIRAEAVRQVANNLIQNSAVVGDNVSVRTFEFGLWENKTPDASTLSLSVSDTKDETKTAKVREIFPLTPKAGSLGGHDLERAAVELDQKNDFPNQAKSNTIFIMLLNYAASQGAPGEQLMGSNAPEYQALLETKDRISGTKDGATLDIPFIGTDPQGKTVEAKIAVVVFVPKTFTSGTLSGGSRTELLTGTGTPVPPVSNSSSNFPIWLFLIPLAGLIAFVARQLVGSGGNSGGWVLEISDTNPETFPLAGIRNNGTIAAIAGANYINDSSEPIATHTKVPTGNRLVRFVKSGNLVKIQPDATLELQSLDGETVLGDAKIKLKPNDSQHTLEFQGDVPGNNGGSRFLNLTIQFRVSKGEV